MKKLISLGLLVVLIFCVTACNTTSPTDISGLEARIASLEEINQTLSEQIADLEEVNQTLSEQIADLEEVNQTLSEQIAELQEIHKYDNKEILSIHFFTIDFFGGYEYHKHYDFRLNEYSTAEFNPETDSRDTLEYTIVSTFTNDNKEIFFKNIKSHGIFKLEPLYKPAEIVFDGGGWALTITFDGGETFISYGENELPPQYKTLDDDFFALSGYKLFRY